MSLLKLMSLTRLTCAASLKRIQNAPSAIALTSNDSHGSPQSNLYPQHRRTFFKPTADTFIISDVAPAENIFSKAKLYIKFHLITKYIYRTKGAILYRNTMDSLNYIEFMKDFKMADTYYSWFLITELHVWMLTVRLMAGGRAGVEVRNNVISAMWEDADARRKVLGKTSTSVVAPHIKLLGHQFNAAIIGYDEGMMSSDQMLAGAIWRRIYQSECNNPELIEKLVAYIRKNISLLDNVPVVDLIWKARAGLVHYNQCHHKN